MPGGPRSSSARTPPAQGGVPAALHDDCDAVVVGAGFGGLGAALTLAEAGARVLLLEALAYPGGCASTFERGGVRHEAGATLLCGLAEGQVFRRWIERHRLDVEVEWLDPVIEFRAPGLTIPVGRRRDGLVSHLCALPGAPAPSLRAFFDDQRRVADALWPALDDPALLPPFGPGGLRRHLRALPRLARLVPLAGRPLSDVVRAHGLVGFEPLRALLEGLCRITVQCGVEEAEAPFALAALDYCFRGAGHVRGGVGELAWALADAVRSSGGEVAFARRATAIAACDGGWLVRTSRGDVRARAVVANVLPQDARRLLGAAPGDLPRLDSAAARVEDGWGAAMLYLVASPPPGAGASPRHLQLVDDASRPFVEGNHVFLSASGASDGGRAPAGRRTVTASTHVSMRRLLAMPPGERAEHVAAVHAAMRRTIARRAPEWAAGVEESMTASPRTFERFTGRSGGHVGGPPRTASVRHYLDLAPRAVRPGLFLAGDSVPPGQGALAAAVGGIKAAEAVLRHLARSRLDVDPPEPPRPAPPAPSPRRARGAGRRAAHARGAARVRVHAEA